jgi:uncharacterized protein involved in tellurium resistance
MPDSSNPIDLDAGVMVYVNDYQISVIQASNFNKKKMTLVIWT